LRALYRISGRDAFVIGRVLAIVLAVIIVVADRLTKVAIQHSMNGYENIPVIPGFLRIIHTENPGAAFGMLAEGNPVLRSIVLIGISSVVLVFVAGALWSRDISYSTLAARSGLGLIFGGAIGNLVDRITRGTVTDFIEVFHGDWSFPAFNVADSAITVGATLLLFEMLRTQSRKTVRTSS
jgi:signal peptidase II